MKTAVIAWAAALLLVAGAGYATGWLIKGGGAAGFDFDTKAPPYQQADLPAGHSKAGFTGFGDTGGVGGSTIVAGRVDNVSSDSVTLATSSGSSTIRVTGQEKLRILQPFAGPIVPGNTVAVLRKAGSDDATAVLVLLDP